MRLIWFFSLAVILQAGSAVCTAAAELPENLRVVLDHTQPLEFTRRGRLPLLVLPISGALASVSDEQAEQALKELDRRGIGYTVEWSPGNFETSLAEALRIGRLQQKLGLRVAANANACLYSFYDGTDETLHVDSEAVPFADESFQPPLGCPFTLEHRIPAIKARITRFLDGYQQAGVTIDYCFADWEIDGPIEWNDAWNACRRCERCRREISNIDDFLAFQRRLRDIRSRLQRVAFAEPVRDYFPGALVGNYGVYPHGGLRYWYDYFERETPEAPLVSDGKAKYRPWAHEFKPSGYTLAMPVIYTWYPTFSWYDFADLDYRWFYNMLLVGTNAGQHASKDVPVMPFVHWTTTAPPEDPSPEVVQFSKQRYQELLWHLLLRGHDSFFLWCVAEELPDEIELVHQVYAAALEYREFLERGTPIAWDVPRRPGPVISGLQLQDRVLVRRSNFGSNEPAEISVRLADGAKVEVPAKAGLHLLKTSVATAHDGLLKNDQGAPFFPLGSYELPASDEALRAMADAGINLFRCGSRADLDRVAQVGAYGWMPLAVQQGASDGLHKRIEAVVDHPALVVWEGPDEIVWTFTAYSFLKERAGFTRDDWNRQAPIAVDYANKTGGELIPKMREGIALVRQLDDRNRPFWMNEAADSDAHFVRQYVDSVDIIGCDYYAVRSEGSDLQSIGRLVNRWEAIGRGRPVWMVLQGFSWHAAKEGRERLYPSFDQSRFTAYDAIVHGARGVLYWGSETIDDSAFRQSIHALTSELSHLQPFLTGDAHRGVEAHLIDDLFDPPGRGVRTRLVRAGDDYLLMLVNEDDHRRLGIDVTGLNMLEGRSLKLLYGKETAQVQQGGFVTRMQPYEVKLFSTNERYATPRLDGRDYQSP